MVRKVLLAALAAAVLVPAAQAGNGNGNGKGDRPAAPGPSAPLLVQIHRVAPSDLPSGIAGAVEVGARPDPFGAVSAASGCGACINTCWSATWANGPNVIQGSATEYQHDSWCGNGAWVTYAYAWMEAHPSGMFGIDQTYGPSQSGGCVGCSSISFYESMNWHWSFGWPVSVTSSGSSWMNVHLQSYGATQADGA